MQTRQADPESTPPSSTVSSEVLPLPLTPTIPTRSPGPSRQVTWSRRERSRSPVPTDTETSSSSITVLPSRAVASRVSSTLSRGGGSDAMSVLAASTRNFALVVLALAPRCSQASSLRARLRRRRSVASSLRTRSAWAST